jgi:hypothetical protein
MLKKGQTSAARKQYSDIANLINDAVDEINATLNSKRADRYLEDIVLLYSFIENLLKWLAWVELLWIGADTRDWRPADWKPAREYAKWLSFYNAQQLTFSLNLIDRRLFTDLDTIRRERNDVIDQFWLYRHRGNRLVLRKKLEKLARTANRLVGVFNKLTRKVGVDEVYELFL